MPLPTDDEAVRLFAERAAAVVPGFTLTEENRADVVSVCRWVEGMPLAVELAVVRLRALSLGELATRLRGRLQSLTGGRRAAVPAHHRTLRATLDWSHELCTPPEQLLWRRISVFAGTSTPAPPRPCAGRELPPEDVLEPLIGLIDKSVVLRVAEEPARYRLLDTLREYDAERLAASGRRTRAARATSPTWRRSPTAPTAPSTATNRPGCSTPSAAARRTSGSPWTTPSGPAAPNWSCAGSSSPPGCGRTGSRPGGCGRGPLAPGGLAKVAGACPERVEALHRLGWIEMILGRARRPRRTSWRRWRRPGASATNAGRLRDPVPGRPRHDAGPTARRAPRLRRGTPPLPRPGRPGRAGHRGLRADLRRRAGRGRAARVGGVGRGPGHAGLRARGVLDAQLLPALPAVGPVAGARRRAGRTTGPRSATGSAGRRWS
ncbi:hypothetical protein NKH77_49530 [Streptomyces sp. M19]